MRLFRPADPEVEEFRAAASGVVESMRASEASPQAAELRDTLSAYAAGHSLDAVGGILSSYSPSEPEWDARLQHSFRGYLSAALGVSDDDFSPTLPEYLSSAPGGPYRARFEAEWNRLEGLRWILMMLSTKSNLIFSSATVSMIFQTSFT